VFPMTPSQSWLFLFLVFYSLGITAYAYLWRSKYLDLQSYRIYERKQVGYKRTQLDELYSKSFLTD
jgi:hypothetical protein